MKKKLIAWIENEAEAMAQHNTRVGMMWGVTMLILIGLVLLYLVALLARSFLGNIFPS